MTITTEVSDKISKKCFRGSWKTEQGEKIILTPAPNNLLIGTFQKTIDEAAGSENFEIVGYYQENLLSFVVDMSNYGFCISWVGKLTNSEIDHSIEAQWTLTQNSNTYPAKNNFCNGFLSGKKMFKKVRC